MFTLQILDRGQTLLYTPHGEPVTLGSGQDSGIRLGEDGIEARHVRLEPNGDGLRLIAFGETRVNGKSVQAVDLQLGDRIEVGRAVLVVGRSVARPAEPEDVLDSPRARPVRREMPKRSRLPLVLVACAVVIAGVLAFLNRGDEGQVEADIATIVLAREAGDLERARAHAAACRRAWQGAEDDRLQRLATEERQTEALAQSLAELEARIMEPASGPYAFWNRELRRIEDEGEPHERTAARMLRSSLYEALQRRPPAPAGQSHEPQLADGGSDARGGASSAPAKAVADTDPAPKAANPEAVVEDADRLAGQGLFAQAIALMQSELGQAVDSAAVELLQRRIESLRAEAVVAMRAVVAEAEGQHAAGRGRDAVTTLVLAQHRFPGTGEFARLGETLRAVEAAVAAEASSRARPRDGAVTAELPRPNGPGSPSPTPSNGESGEPADDAPRVALASLRAHLDRIRDAELAGAFRTAATMLRQAVGMARDRDADFAARLERRAADAELRATFHDTVVAALQSGRKLTVAVRDGGDVVLESVRGDEFVTGDGRKILWSDIAAPGLSALAAQVGATGDAAIGAAGLLYAAGEAQKAETLLAAVLNGDPAMKPVVDRAISIGRGDRADERGYVLGKNGFVSARAIDLKQQTAKIAGRIDGVFRNKDESAREKFVKELLAGGPDALDAVVFAFQQDLDDTIEKLDKGPMQKQVERLAAQRVQLDAARKHALDLIYDEVEYFYPYKPPAVASDRFAQYNRVQAEVNRRTDELRRIWRDDRLQVKLSSAARTALERIEWVSGVLQRLGALDAGQLQRIDWIRAIPAGRSVGIAEFCATVAERIEFEEWQRIEAYNKAIGRELSSSQRELLRITNEYRVMFRHRPLAIVPLICNAAQGHAEEMSRLGYFAHQSPTPGRKWPFDRMKLAGYNFGVSENIALNGSALGAHQAWLGSSGHHRNLLNPRHKEMGIGVDGRNWVQNFGGGSTYERQPAYLAAEPR